MKMKFGNDKNKVLYPQTYTQKYPPYTSLDIDRKKERQLNLKNYFII